MNLSQGRKQQIPAVQTSQDFVQTMWKPSIHYIFVNAQPLEIFFLRRWFTRGRQLSTKIFFITFDIIYLSKEIGRVESIYHLEKRQKGKTNRLRWLNVKSMHQLARKKNKRFFVVRLVLIIFPSKFSNSNTFISVGRSQYAVSSRKKNCLLKRRDQIKCFYSITSSFFIIIISLAQMLAFMSMP